MSRRLQIFLIVGSLSTPAFASDTIDSELSIALYQKIKANFEALFEPGSEPDLQPRSRAEIEEDLRADVTANEGKLVRAVNSERAIERELAARALVFSSEKKTAVKVLMGVLKQDSDAGVRRAAAGTLARLPDAAAVEALCDGLIDDSEGVRSTCAFALGNIHDSRAILPLLGTLREDGDVDVRIQAAIALGKIKEESSLKGMKEALTRESDERVKMVIASAMRVLMGGDDTDTQMIPTESDTSNELATLAHDMSDVEGKLREDRHDSSVQVEGKSIEDRLGQLIDKLDKACNGGQCTYSSGGKASRHSSYGIEHNRQQGTVRNPLAHLDLGNYVPPGTATVSRKADDWSQLPPNERGELIQAFVDEMPERWRKRLEAYFVSVAAEEVKK